MESLPRDVEDLALTVMESLGSSRALSVAILIRHREWDQLANLTVDPNKYLDWRAYLLDAQAVQFLKKYPGLPTTVDRAQVALDNWLSCEKQCFQSNVRLRPYLSSEGEPPLEVADDGISEFFRDVRKTIRRWIGSRPPYQVIGRFGPGATFADKGTKSTIAHKIVSDPTTTAGALGFIPEFWRHTAWARFVSKSGASIDLVDGNRFLTVPKDATKDRPIAVEPSINVFYQLAYGGVLRSRLLKAGFDLDEGQELHRRLAKEGSQTGSLATIDLSNASDTVSYNLVKLLLPAAWFKDLVALRSPKTLVNGRWRLLEKFSSMGNGYTFELETLIFAALCYVSMQRQGISPLPGKNIGCYGDDIILPVPAVRGVVAVLKFCGLTPNMRKTHVDGVFRESCGGDYFNGFPVRSFFLKKEPENPQTWISVANGIKRTFDLLGQRADDVPAWGYALSRIPQRIRRLRGPQDLGDIVIHDEESRWVQKRRHCLRWIKTWGPATYREVDVSGFHPDVHLACALYGVRLRSGKFLALRNGVRGYREVWVGYPG